VTREPEPSLRSAHLFLPVSDRSAPWNCPRFATALISINAPGLRRARDDGWSCRLSGGRPKGSTMSNASLAMILAAMLMPLAACGGARSVDYTPSRGISADIDASRETGAGLEQRGMTTRTEPYGALPWQLDERHQNGP
jgi:predicted small lipoprotein YifL